MRRTLYRIYGTPVLTKQDTVEGKLDFQQNTKELWQRINRIPDSASWESPGSSPGSEGAIADREIRLNRYARHLLSTLIDRYWVLVCHPMVFKPLTEAWPGIYEQ
jgi:hypothetical protein